MLVFRSEKWTKRTVTLPNAGTSKFDGCSEQGANEHNYLDLRGSEHERKLRIEM